MKTYRIRIILSLVLTVLSGYNMFIWNRFNVLKQNPLTSYGVLRRQFDYRRFSCSDNKLTPLDNTESMNQNSNINLRNQDLKLLNFYNVSEEELLELLKSWNQPKFRAEQIRNSVYNRGIVEFKDMKDIPLLLREKLSQIYTIGTLKLESEQLSKDGTIKRAYSLHDGQLIESVLMPYEDGRHTACISSQAGCAMGCVFCATGQMGFSRQLTSTEIFEQAQRFSAELKTNDSRLSNIVFMVN